VAQLFSLGHLTQIMKTQCLKSFVSFASFIICILATSCSTEPSLPPDQLATLRCEPKVYGITYSGNGGMFPWKIEPSIYQIDGKMSASGRHSPINILPGQHDVVITYSMGGNNENWSGRFNAVAGHHYLVNYLQKQGGFFVQEEVAKDR